jgi:hypothetical protein
MTKSVNNLWWTNATPHERRAVATAAYSGLERFKTSMVAGRARQGFLARRRNMAAQGD